MRVIAGSLKGRQLLSPTWPGLRPTSDRLRETLFNVLASRVVNARMIDGYAGTGAVGIEALSRGAAQVTFIDSEPRAQALIAGNLARCGVESGYAIIRATVARTVELLRNGAGFEPFSIVFLDPPYNLQLFQPSSTSSSGPSSGLSPQPSQEKLSRKMSVKISKEIAAGSPGRSVSPGQDDPGDGSSDGLLDLLTAAAGLLTDDGLMVLEHARRQPAPDRAGSVVRTRLLLSGDSSLSFYSCQP